MKEILFSHEPTLHRMLVRFALAVGLLLFAVKVGVSLGLRPENKIAIVLLAAIPAVGSILIEGILGRKSGRRANQRRQLQQLQPFGGEPHSATVGLAPHAEAESLSRSLEVLEASDLIKKIDEAFKISEAAALAIPSALESSSEPPDSVVSRFEELGLKYPITDRDKEILAQYLESARILLSDLAAELNLSPDTVKSHHERLKRWLSISSEEELKYLAEQIRETLERK